MMTIRQLAHRYGLSRATLLYYDRIGLMHPSARSGAGYRLYDADADARLADICMFRNAGLGLDAIAGLLDRTGDRNNDVLSARMRAIDAEIGRLRGQQQVLAAMLARDDDGGPTDPFDKHAFVAILAAAGMDAAQRDLWHRAFETNAPEAHHAFLNWLGLDDKEIGRVRAEARGHEA